jgi:hypothetical protein
MKKLHWNTVRSGNVVMFGDELQIVYEVSHDGDILQAVRMVSFSHENCSTIVSRKSPFKETLYPVDCLNDKCDCRWDFHPYVEVPSDKYSIDAIKVVADTVEKFIDSKIKKIFYAE